MLAVAAGPRTYEIKMPREVGSRLLNAQVVCAVALTVINRRASQDVLISVHGTDRTGMSFTWRAALLPRDTIHL